MQCLAGEGTAWTAEPLPRRAGGKRPWQCSTLAPVCAAA